MKNLKLLIASLSISCTALADVQLKDCDHPNSSQEIYICSKLKLTVADNTLNKEYRALYTYIEKSYSSNQKTLKLIKSKIKNSQLTWIKLRDENCEIEVLTIEPEAQAFETTKNNCLTRETEERLKYLLKLKNTIL